MMNHLVYRYCDQYLELRRTKMMGAGGPEYPILGYYLTFCQGRCCALCTAYMYVGSNCSDFLGPCSVSCLLAIISCRSVSNKSGEVTF